MGGQNLTNLAKLTTNANLVADPLWQPQPNDVVDALVVSGNALFVGGHFTQLGRLPTADDREYVKSLMHPVVERGRIASWIAPPAKGINGMPLDFEYVKPPEA